MSGVVVLNPVTAQDGYGNPISVTQDGYINRVLISAKIENPATIDAYGNTISLTRDDSISANRLLTSTEVENPVVVTDGYGNPISVSRDEDLNINRVFTSAKVENPVTAIDGYGNPISVSRDEDLNINRVFTSAKVENPVTAIDGYGNPISVTRDGYIDANRLLTSSIITNIPKVQISNEDGSTAVINDGYLNANVVQYDTSGNPLAVADNDDIDVNQPALMIAAKDGYESGKARLLETLKFNTVSFGIDRLAVQSTIAPGQSVVIGSPIPEVLGNYYQAKFTTSGGSDSLIVNGSVTPVEFTVNAPGPGDGYDIAVGEIRLVLTTQDITFDGASLGSKSALTNGIDIELIAGGESLKIPTIFVNEDFLFLPSNAGLVLNNTGPKDVMQSAINLGNSPVLLRGTSDKAIIRINDDLTGGGAQEFNFFKAQLYGERINL